MRRLIPAVPAVVLALAPLASAAPTAAPQQGYEVQFDLRTRAGVTVPIAVLASTSLQGGQAQLRLRLDPPGAPQLRLDGTLPAGALTTAGGVTTLRTVVGRLPITVRWTAEPASASIDYGSHAVGPDSARGWTVAGTSGTVSVVMGSARCQIGYGTIGTAVVYDTAGGATPLSRGLGLDLRGAKCHELPDTLPPVP